MDSQKTQKASEVRKQQPASRGSGQVQVGARGPEKEQELHRNRGRKTWLSWRETLHLRGGLS